MRAHGNEGRLGRRFAIVIGLAALGAALIAAGASADLRSVHDQRGDAHCIHERHSGPPKPCSHSTKLSADVVRATAGHEGRRLRHTISVVGKLERVHLAIDSDDSDRGYEQSLVAIRGRGGVARFRESGTNHRTGRASYDFHRHSVEIIFSRGSIGNPRHYGWIAGACAGKLTVAHACDWVPGLDDYIRHELG
jgi:hypothetical protein